ncbi:MAG: glycosyltransferase [Phycisphaerae bacterium]|nr:glycosyltransferase [Phycisphaerae bacterium]MCZ2399102.1 glycosyltransferase [Phycisphaerae bacterium]
MRIVLLITDLQRGGTPLRIVRLARGLRGADVDVHVGCLAPRGPLSDELEAAGVPTFACGARHAADLRALIRLHRALNGLRPDLLHATLTHANVAARLVGAERHIPVIGSTATIEIERRWHLWIERLTAPIDAAHVVHSRALAEHVHRAFRLPRERIHVVPPSVEVGRPVERLAARRWLGLPPDAFVIAWAGRFDRVKRVDVLIDAASALAARGVVVALAGDGPLRPALERRAAASGGRVVFLGWQADLAPLLSATDLFALPSRTEGLPNALLEAMLSGAPAVAFDIPPLRELAGQNQRLTLVPEGDAAAFIAELRRLQDRPELRQRLAAAAREWAAGHLDPNATTRALLRLYDDVLRRSAAAPRGA